MRNQTQDEGAGAGGGDGGPPGTRIYANNEADDGAPVVVLQEARESFRADAEADDLHSPAAPEPPWPGFEPDRGQ
jgi:hypothetical protein